MRALIDTSALVKLVLEEPETSEARSLWDEADPLLGSRLLYPEARSALARARRMGRISVRQLATARVDLERTWNQVQIIEMGAEVASLAGEAAENHGLSAGDAVHLASALMVGGLTMVTWDRRLAVAAHGAGLAVAPALDR